MISTRSIIAAGMGTETAQDFRSSPKIPARLPFTNTATFSDPLRDISPLGPKSREGTFFITSQQVPPEVVFS